MSQSEFERLEEFVAKLLKKHDELRKRYSTLQNELLDKEREIKLLQDQIESADSERGDISRRVKGLIDQIEEWESDIDEEADEDVDEEVDALEEENEPVVEELSADEALEDDETLAADEKSAEEKQQNLFNVSPHSDTVNN